MSKTVVKPIVTLKPGETIVPPTGELNKAIDREKLLKNPEKYVFQYPHLFKNAEEIMHDLNTNSKIVRNGSKVKVNESVTKAGTVVKLLSRKTSKAELGEVKKVNALDAYRKLLKK